MRLIFVVTALLVAVPAAASSPDAMARGMAEAKAACRKASDLGNAATPGKPVLFSDATGKTAVLVTGTWRPPHMHNARATILCLYDRASRTAEVQEAANWSAR